MPEVLAAHDRAGHLPHDLAALVVAGDDLVRRLHGHASAADRQARKERTSSSSVTSYQSSSSASSSATPTADSSSTWKEATRDSGIGATSTTLDAGLPDAGDDPRRVGVGSGDDPAVTRRRARRPRSGHGVAEGGVLEVLDVETGCTRPQGRGDGIRRDRGARPGREAARGGELLEGRPTERHVDTHDGHQDSRPLVSSSIDSRIEEPRSSTSGMASRSALRP